MIGTAPRRWTDLHAAAGAFDRALGDPADPDNPFGFRAMADRHRSGDRPTLLAQRAAALRLSFIPEADGGDLTSLDEAIALVRVAARRDPTVMPMTMISITAASVLLLAGSDEQRSDLVRALRNGESVGFARADHGLGARCRVQIGADGGVRLTGELDFVGFVPGTTALLVLAPTDGAPPAALTAVLLRDPTPAGLRRSTGRFVGGIDFAGVACDVTAGPDAIVGPPGRAVEAMVPALQLVSTFGLAGNLAAADTAVRVTGGFASTVRLGRRPLADQPFSRRRLGSAAAALIAADALALVSARTMHTLPAAAAARTVVARKVVGELTTDAIRWCCEVQSTVAPVRADGVLDALSADNAIIGYLDSSPAQAARLLAPHLLSLSAAAPDALPGDPSAAENLRRACAVDEPLPPLRPSALTVRARGADPVLRELATLASHLEREGARQDVVPLVGAVLSRVRRLLDDIAALSGGRPDDDRLPDLTDRFCWLYAAAACVHLWRGSRHLPLYGAPAGSPAWPAIAVTMLLRRADGLAPLLPAADADRAVDLLEPLRRAGRLLAAVPVPLAESGPATPPERPENSCHSIELEYAR